MDPYMKNPQINYLGLYIKRFMKDHKLTQKVFAEKCNIKQGNLSRILSGKVVSSLDSLVKISKNYGLDLNYLLYLRIKNEFDNLYGPGTYENVFEKRSSDMFLVSKELFDVLDSKEILRNINLVINGKKIDNNNIVLNENGSNLCFDYIDGNNINLLCEESEDYIVYSDFEKL